MRLSVNPFGRDGSRVPQCQTWLEGEPGSGGTVA